MVLTMAVLIGWSYFRESPEVIQSPQETQEHTQGVKPSIEGIPVLPNAIPKEQLITREQIISSTEHIMIKTPSLVGSIRVKGTRIDDLSLVKYNENADGSNGQVTLLSPDETSQPYFAEFGWLAGGEKALSVPDNETLWRVTGHKTLTPDTPVTFLWENEQGIRFERTISIDSNYLFTIKDRVINHGDNNITLYAYGMISRGGIKDVSSFFYSP